MALTGALRLLLGGSYFSVTQQFLQRASRMPGQRKYLYDRLIRGLWQDETWGLLDCLYILAAPDAATALLNLVSTNYSLIANGTTTFTPDRGYAGDGTTGYLDTQFIPGVGSPHYTQNSASVGAYDLTSSTTVSSTATIIGANFNGQSYIQPLTTSSAMSADVNTTTFALGGPNTNRQGAWIVTRTSTSTISLYGPHGSSTPLNTVTTGDTSAVGPNTRSFVRQR
jgi:hypothetical protein